MIRSKFAITRLLVIPYTALLVLYFVVIGGGSAWLWHQVRAAESQLLIDDMIAELEPLAQRLRSGDALSAMRDKEGSLVAEVDKLFANLPALRNMSLRGRQSGYQMLRNGSGTVSSDTVSPFPADARRASEYRDSAIRLHDEDGALFLIRFDLAEPTSSPIRLNFAFDRAQLLARVDEGMRTIKQSILFFGAAGALSILVALGITVVAMSTTRKLESHFQGIYQRASLTETAAQLVHDLRNPLSALRANVQALLVSPGETPQIVREIDQDIVSLNDKLSAFLDLTRQRDEAIAPVDVAELVGDAVRLAEPALSKLGLSVETDISPDLPRPLWQKSALRDALLNLILNATQSGQTEGSIHISARAKQGCLEIAVEDRGGGISKEQMPRLFDAFYTTREDGNGSGLAIVQRIVAEHQGRVSAENRPDGGARVVLTLPLQRKETPRWWDQMNKRSPA
jgi:signal transduction histidine kinase